MNTIKDKVTTSHLCFQSNLISIKKSSKNFFNNFICIIINHKSYIISLWMHYTLFIIFFRRNKINCYCWLNFARIRYFEIIYDIFWVLCNFLQIFFNWQCFISVAVTSIFNIIVTAKSTYSCLFVIIFFLILKKVSNISCYSIFICFNFFFQSKTTF